MRDVIVALMKYNTYVTPREHENVSINWVASGLTASIVLDIWRSEVAFLHWQEKSSRSSYTLGEMKKKSTWMALAALKTIEREWRVLRERENIREYAFIKKFCRDAQVVRVSIAEVVDNVIACSVFLFLLFSSILHSEIWWEISSFHTVVLQM